MDELHPQGRRRFRPVPAVPRSVIRPAASTTWQCRTPMQLSEIYAYISLGCSGIPAPPRLRRVPEAAEETPASAFPAPAFCPWAGNPSTQALQTACTTFWKRWRNNASLAALLVAPSCGPDALNSTPFKNSRNFPNRFPKKDTLLKALFSSKRNYLK